MKRSYIEFKIKDVINTIITDIQVCGSGKETTVQDDKEIDVLINQLVDILDDFKNR